MWEKLREYLLQLKKEEKSRSTCGQYGQAVEEFLRYAGGRRLSRELALEYKQTLCARYRPTTVNAKLAAVNSFFRFLGREELRLKRLRVQKRPFRPRERELSKAEYLRLLNAAAARRDERLRLLLETVCATGIRVSELRYITAQAVRRGEAVVRLKGKTRVILICGKLRRALEDYLRRRGIGSGPVFVTRSGRPLDRSNIWKMMKALCRRAGVAPGKVFPHNLRHLFARCFYTASKDIAQLADVLGHSSINTTRIYLMTSGREHRRRLDSLGLVT